MKKEYLVALIAVLSGFSRVASAEVVSAAPEHYVLKHEASSELAPKQLWARLIDPRQWWHPDHTYSGDSSNLSLELTVGGQWREDWNGNSVLHGTVINVTVGSMLRLDAPFGPLQELAVNTVWTITVEPEGSGSKVTFDEVANGSKFSGLDELAKAVDFVKREALSRLVSKPAG